MFYVNNKQVLGIFLNGNNYNYMSFGFGKIIPENRNARFAYINMAQRYLSQYRVEYGNIQSGYDNFPIARLDYPVNGIFHSPLTYYYGGNIVPTKNVPVYINNGYCAIRGTVYNDINVNGNIVYFAENTDFQGHNVTIHPEPLRSNSPHFDGTVMDNCSNFRLNAFSCLSKNYQVALYGCGNFSGKFNYFGDDDGTRYPGFRGFLHTCRDGVFNFNLINMHGGGSDSRDTNYYNFSCISNCNNIRLTINGSPWQAWVHPNCYSSNCNINTYHVISGFSYMNDCNFNVVLPKDSKPEMDKPFAFLNNAENCNYNLYATDVNLYNYRSSGYVPFFENLNNSNLNLQVNNAVEFGDSLGGNLHNCNIVFDNLKASLVNHRGLRYLYNCNISGNVETASSVQGFIESCDGLNINLNAAKSSLILPMWGCDNVKGNLVAGDATYITYGNYMNLNVSGGSLTMTGVEHGFFNFNGTNTNVVNLNNCKFEIYNCNSFAADNVSNSNFNMRNSVGSSKLSRLDNVTFIGRFDKTTVTNLDNCFHSRIYVNTIKGLIENVYNTYVSLDEVTEYNTVNVYNCNMGGFPGSASYHTEDCTFRVPLEWAQTRFRSYFTWANVWPHATPRGSDGWDTWYSTNAGLESTSNLSRCYLNCNNASIVNSSSISFDNNKNMIMSLLTFYSRTVKVNLPNYATNIKLNVDCHNLNLGVFMAGPPHGLEYSSISADNIFCTTGNNYFVQMNYGTRIYCENFCNVAFSPVWRRFSDNYQPVLLINNYQWSNGAFRFKGGICRIGNLNYLGYTPVPMELYNGACMFINNMVLSDTTVNNALLFLGTNVRIAGIINVTNGGLIVNRANYSMDAIGKFVNRKNFVWNFTDSGPWGWRSLLNFCIDV